jgi:hypothetical protein
MNIKYVGWMRRLRSFPLIFLACILFLDSGLRAQRQDAEDAGMTHQKERLPFVNLTMQHGFILVHSHSLVPVRHSNPSGLILDLGYHRLTRRSWESCRCYPRSGLSVGLWDFDQADILGQALSVQLFVEPVFSAWAPLHVAVRGGFGFAGLTRPYHPVRNPLNQGYSTPLALSAHVGLTLNWRWSTRWGSQLFAGYHHISNGGVKEPNKGINWPAAGLAVSYYPQAPLFNRMPSTPWRALGAPARRMELALFLGFQEPESKAYLFSPGLEFKASRQVARISALTAGGEWVWHQGARFRMARDSVQASAHQVGLSVGHEFLLGRFYFGQQMGGYIYRPYRIREDVFQRYTLAYRYSDRLILGGSLKVYRHVADLLDLRMAFAF